MPITSRAGEITLGDYLAKHIITVSPELVSEIMDMAKILVTTEKMPGIDMLHHEIHALCQRVVSLQKSAETLGQKHSRPFFAHLPSLAHAILLWRHTRGAVDWHLGFPLSLWPDTEGFCFSPNHACWSGHLTNFDSPRVRATQIWRLASKSSSNRLWLMRVFYSKRGLKLANRSDFLASLSWLCLVLFALCYVVDDRMGLSCVRVCMGVCTGVRTRAPYGSCKEAPVLPKRCPVP